MYPNSKMRCDGSRICILMLNSPNIPKYGHLAAMVNYLYAAKHGYNFIVERCPQELDMDNEWMWDGKNEYKLVWSKPALMKRYLQYNDYVVYIDSDAIFIDHEKKIEDVLPSFFTDGKVCMVMAKDCASKDGGCSNIYSDNDLNCGVIIAKKSKETLDVLQGWFDATSSTCEQWKNKFPYEQACMNSIKDTQFNGQIKIVNTGELGGRDGDWIRHMMAQSAEERETYIGGLLKELLSENRFGTVPIVEAFGTGEPYWRASTAGTLLATIIALCLLFSLLYMYNRRRLRA